MKKILKNKIFIAVLVVAIAGGGYYFYKIKQKNNTPTSYKVLTASKGDLNVSVSGSGQVTALNQVDLNPEGSGKIVSVNVKLGDEVKAGQVIATLDQGDNQTALAQAKASLLSAQASYDKVLAGTAAEDLKISKISLSQAKASLTTSKNDLEETKRSTAETVAQAQETYDDLMNTTSSLSNSKRDLVIDDISDKITASKVALDLVEKILNDSTAEDVLSAKDSSQLTSTVSYYNKSLAYVSPANSSLAKARVSKTDGNLSNAVDDTITLLNSVLTTLNYCYTAVDNSITSSTFSQSNLESYKSSVNSQISTINTGISSIRTKWQDLSDAIKTAKDDLENAKISATQSVATAEAKVVSSQNSLETAQANYDKTAAPAETSEIRSAEASLLNAKAQYSSALEDFQKNIITSPIDGQIASLDAQVGDQANSGTAIATIITKQTLAVIPFNEVDTAKIKAGQDATLTFDAVSDLEIKGKVAEVATIGTVTSGVVNYDVKISFDTQNENIKPQMSVSAVIITESKPDVIYVATEAIKTMGDRSFVLIPAAGQLTDENARMISLSSQPERMEVQLGTANDTYTEITSGLSEGDKVLVQIASSSTSSSSSSSSKNAGMFMMGGAAGGPPSDSGNRNSSASKSSSK